MKEDAWNVKEQQFKEHLDELQLMANVKNSSANHFPKNENETNIQETEEQSI